MLLPPNARRPVLQCLLAIHEASSLPVPDSPIGSTRASEPAAMEVCSTARSHAGLEPIIREGASLMSSRRRSFSRRRDDCSNAFFKTTSTRIATERSCTSITMVGNRTLLSAPR